MRGRAPEGFTLAELLIALAILGVIATFTIPKVLQSQQSSQWKSVAKEDIAAFSAAYDQYRFNNTIQTNTSVVDVLTPYINYVRVDTTTTLTPPPGFGSRDCFGASRYCLVMHNGSFIRMFSPTRLLSLSATSAADFYVDPDGSGPAQSVYFFIYYDGKIRTKGTLEQHTYVEGGSDQGPVPANDPAWFDWS